MINKQLGRRNITPQEFDYLISWKYEAEKKEVGGTKDNKNAVKNDVAKSASSFSNEPKRVSEKIAKEHGISPRTVMNKAGLKQAVDELDKEAPVRPRYS